MRGDTHVRFGGRARETDPGQPGHRARARPNRSDTPRSCPTSDHRWSAAQARLRTPHTVRTVNTKGSAKQFARGQRGGIFTASVVN